MKKILIVHAHPEPQSFCSSLRTNAKEYFSNIGWEVLESDLYSMNFNPVGNKGDFTSLKDSSFFKYQQEQVHAYENNLFKEDLKAEMDKFEKCDLLLLNFPLWWFGLPAILKGWIDRVFAMGFVYGNGKGVYDNGHYSNKQAMLCLTTGGPEQAYNGGKNGELDTILFPVQHGMLYFAGMTVIPPFISFSPARKNKDELEAELKRYKNHLESIDSMQPIYKNK